MKAAILGFIFSIFAFQTFGQNPYLIKGFVIDPAENLKLENTSVLVMNAKDSTLVNFTRADNNGNFTVDNLKQGDFILLLSYPGYADYSEPFKLDDVNQTIDFAKVDMVLKSRLLAEVLVKGTANAITIKGDTTEFNAAAYVIQPNSKVEDLIKQFPGIEVDKDGKITAHGETVTKVLVDGEEFFGDDPTLVTKNLRADMVDKVQLYDKKSDQATFTGIDDGVKDKTLNIKLKEDKKKGYFGKLSAGVAKGYYEQQVMANLFTARQKLSVYGTNSNTSTTGLNWRDNQRFGESNTSFSDDGYMVSYGNRDDMSYNGQGIPETRSTAANYENKWDNNKKTLNLNYKLGDMEVNGYRDNLNQRNLPSGVTQSNSHQVFRNYFSRQRLNATYTNKIDSTSTIKFGISAGTKNTQTNDDYNSETYKNIDTLQNRNKRMVDNNGDQQNVEANLLWNKKLKKQRRTVSINTSIAYNKNNSEGYLNSENIFFNPGSTIANLVIDSTVNINQLKLDHSEGTNFNTNVAYTEPITKSLSLVFNYRFGLNNRTSNKQSLNQSASGRYDQLDSLYSNNFELQEYSNQAGAIFNYKKDKTTLNFGTKVALVDFNQIDTYTDTRYDRNFINLNPQVNYQYKFSNQEGFRVDYNGSSRQPGIYDIQPIRNNTDPLNIYIGNPSLKPSFNHRLNASYQTYKVLNSRYFFIDGSYSFTENSFVNKSTTDSVGKTTYQSVNLSDKRPNNYNMYFNFSRKIGPINGGFGGGINGNTYYNYVNGELNKGVSNSYSISLNASAYKESKYDFYVTLGPRYRTGYSSLQKNINNNGWELFNRASFNVYLPLQFEFGADGEYQYQQKTSSFDNSFQRTIINSSIRKKFFKEKNLVASVSVRDLLNQNVGFNRSAYDNTISQSSYNTIKRYFMFSLIWDFNKMGIGTKVKTSTKEAK